MIRGAARTRDGEQEEPNVKRTDVAAVLGIPVNGRPLDALVAEALAAVRRAADPIVFACANPHSLVIAQDDACFRAALLRADQLVVDGVGITLMARALGMRIGPRITGADYFFALMRALSATGRGKVFFLGSSQQVLARIAARLKTDFPGVELCGTLAPPFRPWSGAENDAMLARINAAAPDVLWVGMTAPKQEMWVEANRHRLAVPIIGSIGAVFDFYAGTVPRAPRWMCRCGIEWVYRLAREPKRMWRRNLISSPRFVAMMIQRQVLDENG